MQNTEFSKWCQKISAARIRTWNFILKLKLNRCATADLFNRGCINFYLTNMAEI